MTEIDEDGREGCCHRQPVPRDVGIALTGGGKYARDDPEIECKPHRLKQRQRERIGQQRKRCGDEKEDRRIEPAVVGRLFAEQFLLAGVLRGGLIGAGRMALKRERAGSVEARKIRPDGFAIAINEAV